MGRGGMSWNAKIGVTQSGGGGGSICSRKTYLNFRENKSLRDNHRDQEGRESLGNGYPKRGSISIVTKGRRLTLTS